MLISQQSFRTDEKISVKIQNIYVQKNQAAETAPTDGRVAANIQHMQARATDKVLSCSLEVGQGLVTPCYKQSTCYRISDTALNLDRSCTMT
jgi:hypothetical protein